MPRPRRDDPLHVGRTETFRVPDELSRRIKWVAGARGQDVAALLDPVLEPFVAAEFAKIPGEVLRLVEGGTPAQVPRPGQAESTTGSLRVRAWTAWRLNIIAAVRRTTIGAIVGPMLTAWVATEAYAEATRVAGELGPAAEPPLRALPPPKGKGKKAKAGR